MRKAVSILLAFVLFCSLPAFSEDIDSLLSPSLSKLYADKTKPLVVCFGSFTYADKGLSSEFSRYLESAVALALQKNRQFELFARDKLEGILETQQLNLSDIFSEKDPVRIGNLKSIKAMLAGRFFDAGKDLEVFLEMIAVETGTVSGSAKVVIPKTLIPRNVSLLPDNYNDAVAVLNELKKIDPNENRNLMVKAWTKRGNGGTYIDGEELVIHFYANSDCYIKIYHIDVNGDMKLIFPNQYHDNNEIKKNVIYSIPDESYGFAFKLGKPFGTEFIKIIASTKQFKDIEESFSSLGKSSKDLITRGLSVQQREAKITEVMLSYTILEK
jgi:hypothetical protein